MSIPVFWHEDCHVAIRSYGRALQYDPSRGNVHSALKFIEMTSEQAGCGDVLWQRFSSDRLCPERFKTVEYGDIQRRSEERVFMHTAKRFNGIILRGPGAIACATRDCPIVVLWSRTAQYGSPIAVFHLNRDSSQGTDIGADNRSVLLDGVQNCLREWGDLASVYGVITLSIASKHFSNEQHPRVVESLQRHWGSAVVPDPKRHTIDLVALARAQLASLGINPKNIVHDGLDTYSDLRLASTRRGHHGYHNLVFVAYRN